MTSSKLEGNTQPGPLLEGWLYSWQSPAEDAHCYSSPTQHITQKTLVSIGYFPNSQLSEAVSGKL